MVEAESSDFSSYEDTALSDECLCFTPLSYLLTGPISKYSHIGVFIAQSCLTLCDPMDCSPPGSSVHGILQARILEWVTIPSSRGIFSTQGLNVGLLHCRWILYCLSQGWSLNLQILRGGRSIPKHIGLGPTLRSYLWFDYEGFPGGTSGKEPACQCKRHKRWLFDPWVGKIPWRRAWQPMPVFLPAESHGRETWWARVHRAAKSRTQLKQLSM